MSLQRPLLLLVGVVVVVPVEWHAAGGGASGVACSRCDELPCLRGHGTGLSGTAPPPPDVMATLVLAIVGCFAADTSSVALRTNVHRRGLFVHGPNLSWDVADGRCSQLDSGRL